MGLLVRLAVTRGHSLDNQVEIFEDSADLLFLLFPFLSASL